MHIRAGGSSFPAFSAPSLSSLLPPEVWPGCLLRDRIKEYRMFSSSSDPFWGQVPRQHSPISEFTLEGVGKCRLQKTKIRSRSILFSTPPLGSLLFFRCPPRGLKNLSFHLGPIMDSGNQRAGYFDPFPPVSLHRSVLFKTPRRCPTLPPVFTCRPEARVFSHTQRQIRSPPAFFPHPFLFPHPFVCGDFMVTLPSPQRGAISIPFLSPPASTPTPVHFFCVPLLRNSNEPPVSYQRELNRGPLSPFFFPFWLLAYKRRPGS